MSKSREKMNSECSQARPWWRRARGRSSDTARSLLSLSSGSGASGGDQTSVHLRSLSRSDWEDRKGERKGEQRLSRCSARSRVAATGPDHRRLPSMEAAVGNSPAPWSPACLQVQLLLLRHTAPHTPPSLFRGRMEQKWEGVPGRGPGQRARGRSWAGVLGWGLVSHPLRAPRWTALRGKRQPAGFNGEDPHLATRGQHHTSLDSGGTPPLRPGSMPDSKLSTQGSQGQEVKHKAPPTPSAEGWQWQWEGAAPSFRERQAATPTS